LKHVATIWAALLLAAATLAAGGAATWRLQPDARRPIQPLSAAPALDSARVALGERLYHDPRLSAGGKLSCQSCHNVGTNGASPWPIDRGDDGTPMRFNTPTVFNSTLNFRFGWQGQVRTAPEIVAASLRNPHVMGGDGLGLQRLRADAGLMSQARGAYHRDLDEAVAIDALTAYLRTLITPHARFDRWLAGDEGALTAQEKRGWGLFQSVGCVSCHQGVNVGGNLFERHGIFHPLALPDPPVLRVPSLRNVAATAPYFQDGSARTLPAAVTSMAHAQLDVTLSARDVQDIVAFLDTLTGTYQGRAVQAEKP